MYTLAFLYFLILTSNLLFFFTSLIVVLGYSIQIDYSDILITSEIEYGLYQICYHFYGLIFHGAWVLYYLLFFIIWDIRYSTGNYSQYSRCF